MTGNPRDRTLSFAPSELKQKGCEKTHRAIGRIPISEHGPCSVHLIPLNHLFFRIFPYGSRFHMMFHIVSHMFSCSTYNGAPGR